MNCHHGVPIVDLCGSCQFEGREAFDSRLRERLGDAEGAVGEVRSELDHALARVEVLEAEKLALDTCWRCKVTLEKVGSHESRVPRCTECPESMDDGRCRPERGW